MPGLPTGLAGALATQRLRSRLGERRVRRRRLRGVPTVLVQLPPQVGDLGLQLLDLLSLPYSQRHELLRGRASIGGHHTMITTYPVEIN
jgi:hypothetical protein